MFTGKDLGKTISKNFKHSLTEKELTIPKLAKKLGQARFTVNNFLNRLDQGSATLDTICKYANALGVSPYELFYESKLVPRKIEKKGEK